MYEALIAHLRECAKLDPSGNTYTQAADAIDELQAAEKKYLANIGALEAENQHLKRGREWIPVTERLPCLTTPVLATDGIEVDIAWMYGVPPRWITSFTAIDEDKLTHWMPLPKTPQPQDDCPLVPVPPHGRLIDADAFISFIRENWDSYDQWFAEMLEARPTIIPAEEAET